MILRLPLARQRPSLARIFSLGRQTAVCTSPPLLKPDDSRYWSIVDVNLQTTPPTTVICHNRYAHSVPSLGVRDANFSQRGVGDLFSPEAFKVAWTDYQQHLVSRLNTLLADDSTRSTMDVKTLLQNTAREPSMAAMFNYASMAHNNFFFFRNLSPTTTKIPSGLSDHLISSFSSIDTLRSTMLTTASAMFGPGFVWLVQTERPSTTHPAMASSSNSMTGRDRSQIHFRILATYLAGSPYPQAHVRQQSRDMNTHNLQSVEDYTRQTRPQNTAGSFGGYSAEARGMAGIGAGDIQTIADTSLADCIPVLCVNTWEHCYLQDFGVAGKNDYLEKWWDSIDWESVWSLCIKKDYLRLTR